MTEQNPLTLAMHPRAVVLDLVLKWVDTIGVVGTAKVADDGALFLTTRNHRDEYVMLSVSVNLDGEPRSGLDARFVLRRLGPGVWKLAPSVLHDKLHAYVTLVDVPEPAPFLPGEDQK